MKRSQRIKAQGRLLDDIMRWKRKELAARMSPEAVTMMQAMLTVSPPALDFTAAVSQPDLTLIPELKRATPGRGLLSRHFDATSLAVDLAKAGAPALAYASDARYFQGQMEELGNIRQQLREHKRPVPLLRHDFIFDLFQMQESRVAGADAVFLHVSIVGDRKLRQLLALANELGMAAVPLVHNEKELARALAARPRLICLSARQWGDYSLAPDTFARLRRLLPDDVLPLAAGGIATPEQIQELKQLGFAAAVIGEALIKKAPQQRLAYWQQMQTAAR